MPWPKLQISNMTGQLMIGFFKAAEKSCPIPLHATFSNNEHKQHNRRPTDRSTKMAAPMPTIMRTLTRRSAQHVRPTQRCLAALRFYSSEEAPPPPLLAKLKGDLKTAMRAKDAPRLAVLRSVLSATLNASKTASPIKTDQQLVALLRKQAKTQKESVEEFRGAGREDLVEKEMAQIQVLEEYASASGVATVSAEEIRGLVQAVKAELAAEGITGQKALGETMKRLFAPGGPLEGKDVEKGEVSTLAKEVLL